MAKMKRVPQAGDTCDECKQPFKPVSNNELMICAAPDKKGKNVKMVCGECYQIIVDHIIEQEEIK